MKRVRQAIMDDNLTELREEVFETYGYNAEHPKNF